MFHPFGALMNIHALMLFNTGLVVFTWEWGNIHQTPLIKETMDKCYKILVPFNGYA